MMKNVFSVFGAIAFCVLLATQGFAKEVTIRGKLQRTVEPGGWVLVTKKTGYLILNARTFAKEKWFAAGNEVEATGEIKSGVVTAYMEGTPFEASSMRPCEQRESDTSASNSCRLTPVMAAWDSRCFSFQSVSRFCVLAGHKFV